MSTNPSAFPVVVPQEYSFVHEGMTLRDYFAGQALAGLLAHASGEAPESSPSMAYKLADAMLAEREKGA